MAEFPCSGWRTSRFRSAQQTSGICVTRAVGNGQELMSGGAWTRSFFLRAWFLQMAVAKKYGIKTATW